MAVRDSKRALAEVAALLGTDTPAARSWLRTVQHHAGPVPYDQIAAALRRVDGHDPERVARAVTEGRAGTDPDHTDRTVTDGSSRSLRSESSDPGSPERGTQRR